MAVSVDGLKAVFRDLGAGAFERVNIWQSAAGDGRITSRIVAGETYSLSYGAEGRLSNYSGPGGYGDYEFDHLGRRTKMTVTVNGQTTATRMVYQGHDVIAELIDEGDNGSIDRRRLYWILPQIDQRIGFVDIEGSIAKAYYYETDQVGSVLQVRDASGAVVNRYIYDAFGNQLPGTFEEVPNRYRFQGREWDEGIQAYYFRYRHYFPETGQFSGPDYGCEDGGGGNGSLSV